MINERELLHQERKSFFANRAIFKETENNLHHVVKSLLFNYENKVERVCWSEMAALPMNQKIFIGHSWFEKIYSDNPDILKFTCTLQPGAILSEQEHDFIEKIKVIKGEFINYVTNIKYGPGETAVFEIEEVHQPGSEVLTELIVTMHRSNVNVTPSGHE